MFFYNSNTNYFLEKLFESKRKNAPADKLNAIVKQMSDSVNMFDRFSFGSYVVCSSCNHNHLKVRADIPWKVIAKDGSKLLLISENCIDWQGFEEDVAKAYWPSSTVCRVLNEVFYVMSFSETEKTIILTTNVETEPNVCYGGEEIEASGDKLFLLSVEEVDKYFGGNDSLTIKERIVGDDNKYLCLGNNKAQADILYIDDPLNDEYYVTMTKHPHKWWLRTNGANSNFVSFVCDSGEYIDLLGLDAESDEVGIRPAMWIDLSLL